MFVLYSRIRTPKSMMIIMIPKISQWYQNLRDLRYINFGNIYSSSNTFLKHLEAFLEIASTQKVCAESRERTRYHFISVENCQERVQFWVWKNISVIANDYGNHRSFKLKIEHVPDNSRHFKGDIWFVLELLHIPSA